MLAKSRWWSPILGLFLAFVMLVLTAPPARVANRLGVAVKISGETWVKRSVAHDWIRLMTGADILAGDQIQVDTGEAEILMTRGDHIHLEAGSKMTFSKASLLRLTLGEAWFRIQALLNNEGFSVETPAGVVGVRGTVFSVSVESSGETMVRVLNGEVSVENSRGRVLAGPRDAAILHSVDEKEPPSLEGHGDETWPELEKWSEEREHEETSEAAHHEDQTQGHESESRDTKADDARHAGTND